MDLDEINLEAEEAMERAVSYLQHEFASIRTGKASPSLVENLDVEAYGTSMKLKQLAVISAPEARLLVIQPFDANTTQDIAKAIQESRLGINPAVEGKIIRLPIPELSEDRRRELVKAVRQIAEESRVRVRSSRREAIEAARKLQKEGKITEDDLKIAEKDIQKLTDDFIKKIDEHLASKEAELMRI
ncbi:MAG: ribosome recycling factor [Chthoniobacterales bacterium]|nr:ribosome recycling factor [Chthoniobacterales bacterium]MCX7712762.1 ribosome recycling factor [Chthoniobacterales bacterium]